MPNQRYRSRSSELRPILLIVRGMQDARSAASVSSALSLITGVRDVDVTLSESKVSLSIDPRKVDAAQLRTAVAAVGFEVASCFYPDLVPGRAAA